MKKIILMASVAVLALTSCDDMLDSENRTQPNTGNFPAQVQDLDMELTAAYSVLNQFNQDPLQGPWLVNNLMSDECNGGGGTGDVEASAIANITTNKDALFDKAYTAVYAGVARANTIIYSVDNFNWPDKSKRDQLLGEAYFLRGLYYLWGSQFFGDIPAYWQASAPSPCPQQSAEDVIYPHILADFQSAYNLMQTGGTTKGDGHATKGAAAGYLARAYMFYQGFYKQAGELATADLKDIPLPAQEADSAFLTKKMVVNVLESVAGHRADYGYDLIQDFRRLWQYTNEYTTNDGYPYVSDLAASKEYWAGNGNDEEVFQVQFTNCASWNGTIQMGFINQNSLYCSLRTGSGPKGIANGLEAAFPYGEGWGQGVFNYNMKDNAEWEPADKRKKATILDVEDEIKDGFDYVSDAASETGLYNKKILAVTSKQNKFDGTASRTWWALVRGSITQSNGNSMQGDHFADLYLMRFSDILLMHTELTGDKKYMNEVRKRAGLAEANYNWKQIKLERLHEFMGEGLRFNDLRRWSGKNGGASCEAALALEKQTGSKAYYMDHWTVLKHATCSWAQRYAETDGFLKIPVGQIKIIDNESVLKQNPGWRSEDVAHSNIGGCPVLN